MKTGAELAPSWSKARRLPKLRPGCGFMNTMARALSLSEARVDQQQRHPRFAVGKAQVPLTVRKNPATNNQTPITGNQQPVPRDQQPGALPLVPVGGRAFGRKTMTEQQPFELVRRYPAHVLAEVQVHAPFDRAGNAAFRCLFKYISGNNTARESVAMTAPWSRDSARRRNSP